jgi:hypothetical protein
MPSIGGLNLTARSWHGGSTRSMQSRIAVGSPASAISTALRVNAWDSPASNPAVKARTDNISNLFRCVNGNGSPLRASGTARDGRGRESGVRAAAPNDQGGDKLGQVGTVSKVDNAGRGDRLAVHLSAA